MRLSLWSMDLSSITRCLQKTASPSLVRSPLEAQHCSSLKVKQLHVARTSGWEFPNLKRSPRREIHLQSMHKGFLTCHVLLQKFKLSGAFYPVLTFPYCVDELGLGQEGHGKCLTALDHSTGYGVLLCPVFYCCSQMMSQVPSYAGAGGGEPQAAPSVQPLPPEVQGLVGKLRQTDLCRSGDPRLTCLPFEDLYFWLCWNLLGAGKTASSSKVVG